jgi:hypothetical protein
MTMMTNEQEQAALQLGLMELRQQAWVLKARDLAAQIAFDFGCVSINDLRPRMQLPPGASPALWGTVFRDRRFKATGYGQATHKGSHARTIRIYTLRSN